VTPGSVATNQSQGGKKSSLSGSLAEERNKFNIEIKIKRSNKY
jgi:hypothetical protein